MKFAHAWWLFGSAVSLAVAIVLIASGFLLLRAVRRFGDEPRVSALTTGATGARRAFKGILTVLAVGFAFVAAAQPQYGRGTRTIPATNLDVVIVLDFSKSMYARDIAPSRMERAKIEIGRLISDLPGARFAAVAFAGEPIAFPLTSDGSAVAQFFRQLEPNDMPVGGTAIGRAIEAAREVLARDTLSKKHRKVLVLVTDGEDLAGDPVAAAEAAAQDEITIHVVQIGGRTPEPIPEVGDEGDVRGFRTDESGRPLMTSLSAEGEATLGRIAEVGHGSVVRSERGSTGISEVARTLKRMMSQELSERVETVYADVFHYPLALAIALLICETFVSQVRRPRRKRTQPPSDAERAPGATASQPSESGAAPVDLGSAALGVGVLLAIIGLGSPLTGCDTTDRAFVRNSPVVDDSIEALDAGDAGAAVELLSRYLSTGKCEAGEIGAPASLGEKPHAGFDLGLGLFALAERFGRRFGEEESPDGASPAEQAELEQRTQEAACALRVVRTIAQDPEIALELRARAHYLAGNLEFLRRAYKEAVAEYDQSLKLIPGMHDDAGDGIGRDAAHNRAIALRRLEEQEDAGADAQQDGPSDAAEDAPDGGPDAADASSGEDAGADTGTDGDAAPDALEQNPGGDAAVESDGGRDASAPDAGDQGGPDGGAPPEEEDRQPRSGSQDERILDMLEQAPTFQQQHAKQRALQRRITGGMVDK